MSLVMLRTTTLGNVQIGIVSLFSIIFIPILKDGIKYPYFKTKDRFNIQNKNLDRVLTQFSIGFTF